MSSGRRMISKQLRDTVKLSKTPGYWFARKIHRHRSTLSAWINGISCPADENAVVELGRLLGVPADECFAPEGALCSPNVFPWEIPPPPTRRTAGRGGPSRPRRTSGQSAAISSDRSAERA
jgi:hypothetical protein